jgi:8-hydroxy-5-deazaflavin:NADPH oxidoreductase
MRIAIIGTGRVGRTLAGGFTRAGHDVVVGTRDPGATRQREEWADSDIALAATAEAASGADLVVNATSGHASVEALRPAAGSLAGTVLLDLANPLDLSAGFPPTLTVKDTDSLAEQIQREFPDARVVKSLNTVNARVMVDPARLGEETTIFVAGNDASARQTVTALLRELGWRDIVEFGSLDAARGLEMWLPLWVRLMGTFETPDFNLRLVR